MSFVVYSFILSLSSQLKHHHPSQTQMSDYLQPRIHSTTRHISFIDPITGELENFPASRTVWRTHPIRDQGNIRYVYVPIISSLPEPQEETPDNSSPPTPGDADTGVSFIEELLKQHKLEEDEVETEENKEEYLPIEEVD